MKFGYGGALACVGFVFTFFGQIVVSKLFQGKNAPIVFSIAAVILVRN
jgi:hypothetical protein